MDNPNQEPSQPGILPGDPLPLSDADLDKAARITQADIARALERGRRANPFMRAMIDAKPTNKGKE